MDLEEFRDEGFLQEANRQFFHQLGLALSIRYDSDTGQPIELVVLDWRDDPEGAAFVDLTSAEDARKYENIAKLQNEKATVRTQRFGWVEQPIGTVITED